MSMRLDLAESTYSSEKLMDFMLVTEYCLIIKVQEEVKLLSLEK